MLRYILIICLLLSLLPAQEEEEIDLADLEEEPAPTTAHHDHHKPTSGLSFSLYGDFVINYKVSQDYYGSNDSGPLYSNRHYFAFDKDHFYLLGRVGYKDKVFLGFDIAGTEYYELQFNFSRRLNLRLGKIWLPFGEANFHYIYGGKVDYPSQFLPTIFSDWGLGLNFCHKDRHIFDWYIVNGFGAKGDGLPAFNRVSVPGTENIFKALGFKYKFSPKPSFYWSLSLLYDMYSPHNYFNDFLFMYGTDIKYKIKMFELRAGVVFAEIVDHTNPPEEQFIFKNTYYRWAWYGEASLYFNQKFKLRFRAGDMDPDNRVRNQSDNLNFNLAGQLRISPFVFELQYHINRQRYGLDEFSDTAAPNLINNYHEILLITLLKF